MIERRMQSEVFLRHDIESILKAIDGANAELATRIPGPEVEIYRAGFIAALEAVATALHISLTSPQLHNGEYVDAWPKRDLLPSARIFHSEVDRD